jgi:DNA-binding transcriptional ArsR family regulator
LRNRLKIPRTILSPKKIEVLSPQEKDFYIRNVILEILRLNERRGITVSQIVSYTSFNRMTISKHLDILVATGEAYKIQRGNLFIYYKNGRIVHETDVESVVFLDKTYTLYKLENNEGKFIYLQEKELDEFRVPQVKGGVMIDMKDIPNFIKKLREFVEKEGSEWIIS